METLIDSIMQKCADSINYMLDDKFKECCRFWNVDTSNEKQMLDRCEVKNYDGEQNKELWIDGFLVMVFTMPEFVPMDIKPYNNKVTINTEYKCSDVFTPEYYGISDRYQPPISKQ